MGECTEQLHQDHEHDHFKLKLKQFVEVIIDQFKDLYCIIVCVLYCSVCFTVELCVLVYKKTASGGCFKQAQAMNAVVHTTYIKLMVGK